MSRSVEAQGLAALLNLDAYVEQARAQASAEKTTAAEAPAAPAVVPVQTASPGVAAEKPANGVVTSGESSRPAAAASAGENQPRQATSPAQRGASARPPRPAPAQPLSRPHPDFVDTQPAHKLGLEAQAAAEAAQASAAAADAVQNLHNPSSAATGTEPHRSLGRVGPYELRVALPHDGLGQVFKAWDSNDGIDVMVTLLDLEADARDRDAVIAQMQKSVLAAAALQHPGLARILDAGVVGEGVYIVNEWSEGRSLGLAQRAGWQPTARIAACLVRDLAQALAHAHAHGVLHGGLNPSTVLLDANDQASVLGLGFAATAHASDLPSMDPLVSGAAPYLAPEQLQGGEVDERTDVHALGVLLYELLAGHRAYPGDTVPDVARALMSHDPAPPHWLRLDVPERLSAIAMQALQRNPAARYMHASQVAAALSAWLEQSEGDTDEAREYFVNAEAQPKPGPKKSHWVSASLLAAAAVVVAFTWVERSENSSTAADGPAPAAVVAPAATGAVKTVDGMAEAAGANPAPVAATTAAPTATPAAPSAQPPAAANADVQPAAALPPQPAAPLNPAEPAAGKASLVLPRATGAATEVPTGAVQPAAAAAPAQVAQAVVPAADPKAPARTVAKPRAGGADAASPAVGGKPVARDKPKAGAADARAAAPVAVQTGTVQLAVSPWGYVEVGGKPAGASPPLQKLTLPEGTHTITIRNEDFAPYTTTVQVSADKAATVRHRFPQ